jgi:signal transduction histidine kinase
MRSLVGRVAVQIALLVTVVVLGVTGLDALVLRFLISERTMDARRQIVEEGVALARLAVASGATGEALRRELGPLPNIAVVYYDDEGRILARSRDDVPVREALDEEARSGAAAEAGAAFHLVPLTVGERTEAVAATFASPVAYVGVFEDTPRRTMHSIRLTIPFAIAVVGLLVASLLTWLLVRRARASIAATERVVRRMSEGDLTVRLPAGGDDEIGALVRDFNRMADRLADHVSRLEQEGTLRRQLFAALTHEINTPLTSVLGYLESLAMPEVDADDATRRRYVQVAWQQAQELAALAEDLTMLSRLEYDGVELERSQLDVMQIVQREVEGFRARAAERDVELVVEGTARQASVDPVRFGQVLRILLDNAVRHARAGTAVRVVVAGDAIEVIDRGEGIDAELLAQLGTPLFRTDEARDRARGGRGLGLSIAKGLVEAHGGALTFDSRVGEGTTARVAL